MFVKIFPNPQFRLVEPTSCEELKRPAEVRTSPKSFVCVLFPRAFRQLQREHTDGIE